MQTLQLELNPQLYNLDLQLYNFSHNFMYRCLKCKKYNTKSSFYIRNHVRQHLKLKVPFNCENTTLEVLRCKECNFSTDFTLEFREHLKNHVSVNKNHLKWFMCNSCTYKSRLKGSLKRHIIWKHTSPDEIQWFCCERCPYKSKGKRNLQYHVVNKHDQNEEKCEVFNKFNDKYVKQFKCKLCTYECKTKSNLRTHFIWKHTPPDEIQWFQCEKCPYKSKGKSNLQTHVLNNHDKTKEKCKVSTNCDDYLQIHREEQSSCKLRTYERKTKSSLRQQLF